MVKIEYFFKQGKISRIIELELNRYLNFFSTSYKDNLAHSIFVIKKYPRWSIISGYYTMHDITKLLLAKKYRIKVEREVHSTTISILKELIKNKELFNLFEKGYKEFIFLANDLAEAKKDRVKVQYYTGTEFMREEYEKRAIEFNKEIVFPYLKKIEVLLK